MKVSCQMLQYFTFAGFEGHVLSRYADSNEARFMWSNLLSSRKTKLISYYKYTCSLLYYYKFQYSRLYLLYNDSYKVWYNWHLKVNIEHKRRVMFSQDKIVPQNFTNETPPSITAQQTKSIQRHIIIRGRIWNYHCQIMYRGCLNSVLGVSTPSPRDAFANKISIPNKFS